MARDDRRNPFAAAAWIPPFRGVTVSSPQLPNRFRWIWAVALAGTVVLASGNNPQVPVPSFVGLDKLAHFGVFGLLATLVLRPPAVWGRPRWRAWLAIGAVSLFGITDEWHQSFTPGRAVEFADWVADTSGAALAVVLYLRWSWYRRVLETPLLRRGPSAVRGAEAESAAACPAPERQLPVLDS